MGHDTRTDEGRALHVVFGQGQIGSLVAAQLRAKGLRVRVVRRSPGAALEGFEQRLGDARDEAFARQACEGAAVVYHCLNVPYPEWETVLPALTTSLRKAAAGAGARLVVLDNLYMLGLPDGPLREDSPRAPRSKKGALRQRLESELLEHAERGLDLSIGRAADFFGPEVVHSAIFHARNLDRLAAGRTVEVLGDPAQPHAYAFAADVARGLVTLGTHENARGLWHLPAAFQGTTSELVAALAARLGTDARTVAMPPLLARVVGLFVPLVKEALEMSYQWKAPFLLDDTRFRSTFGVEPTPVSVAIDETARWIASRTGAKADRAPSSPSRMNGSMPTVLR